MILIHSGRSVIFAAFDFRYLSSPQIHAIKIPERITIVEMRSNLSK